MPQLLIHRGLAKKKFLENNLNSFKYCFNKNYGIETDIHATKDNEFICFHDFSLKRIFKKNLSVKNLNYSFRKSHGLSARIVNFAEKKGVKLDKLNLSDYQEFDKNIDKTVYNAISLQSSVDNKKSFGGTSRSGVKEMIKLAKKEILK